MTKKEQVVPAPFVATKAKASRQIGVMVTPERFEEIAETAKNDGITVSEYIRQLIDNDLSK